jgi:hypothetical protein
MTGDELRQIEDVLRRIRSLRARRSTRASQ